MVVILEDANDHDYHESLDPQFYPDHPEDGHLYQYAQEQYMMGRMERFSITTNGHYDLSENVQAFMESTYTNRYSRTRMAPEPVGFGTGNFPGQVQMPITNPYIPADYLELVESFGDDTL